MHITRLLAVHRTRPVMRVNEGHSRQPSENELAIARYQGRHIAQIARKLAR